MKIKYVIIAVFFSLSCPVFAQTVELDALEFLSTGDLSSKQISDYDIFLYRLGNKKLNTEEKLLFNYYSSIFPFLQISPNDKGPVAENKLRDYVNSKTISAVAKGCSELLEYEKKTGSTNKTAAISRFILHSNSLIQYTAASYIREDHFTEAMIVIRSALILASQKHSFTDAELFALYATQQNENKELDLAEKCLYQVIKMEPKYFEAYYNLSAIKINREIEYQSQLTKLYKLVGSQENVDAYGALETARNKNRIAIVPILEKALELQPDNVDIKKSLLSFYKVLSMTDKYDALKNKT